MAKEEKQEKIELTKEELQVCAQAVANATTVVSQAPRLIELMNKLGVLASQAE